MPESTTPTNEAAEAEKATIETTETESKPWYKSKTIWGGLVAFGATVYGIFGGQITAEEQTALTEGITTAVGAGALALTIWGRGKADKKIGSSEK